MRVQPKNEFKNYEIPNVEIRNVGTNKNISDSNTGPLVMMNHQNVLQIALTRTIPLIVQCDCKHEKNLPMVGLEPTTTNLKG